MKKKTIEKKTREQEQAAPMKRIKQSFNQGVTEGRKALLKKLMQAKGIEMGEIQKLYSTGLMEPELLEDLTIGDLVKASGIGMDFAKIIKDVLLRKDSDLPFEYEKIEIDRLNKETKAIRLKTEEVRKEIEEIDKERLSFDAEMKEALDERMQLERELEELKEKEKNSYFNEKRIQDELMFILREQSAFQKEVDRCSGNYGYSQKELNYIKREFLFTKGECNHILEKINFLVSKLDQAIKVKGASQGKMSSFIEELRRIHDTLVEANKKTSVKYYANKQS
jgi:hypothetical protein